VVNETINKRAQQYAGGDLSMKCLCLLLLTVSLGGTAAAQERSASDALPSSPIMDMIDRAKNSINNLQYTQARTAAREILALGKLKRTQQIAALEVAAAAYFPDDTTARMADSATIYLRRLARLFPVGQLPADLVSPGLDSLLDVARRRTFGATARPPLSMTLKGTDSRLAIEVESTIPARWQLYLVTGDGGPSILLDTLGRTTGGRLSLRAHNGTEPMIQPGAHQFSILSIPWGAPDTITLRFDGTATGSVPVLVEMPPPLSSSQMLPERATRALGGGIAAGLVTGAATWALSNALRPSGALGKEPKDNRAFPVAIGISLGAIAGGILDRGRPLPDNVRKNAKLRADYLKRLGDATETNRKRVSDYTVVLTINPEIR
jgi:hypothetical protein